MAHLDLQDLADRVGNVLDDLAKWLSDKKFVKEADNTERCIEEDLESALRPLLLELDFMKVYPIALCVTIFT